MNENREIVANRRRRLRELIASKYAGRQAALVDKIGINQGELSGLLNQKSFGEKKARALEEQLGLMPGWLDGAENDSVVEEFAAVYTLSDATWRTFLQTALHAAKRALKEAEAIKETKTDVAEKQRYK